MAERYPQLPALLAVALLISCIAWPFSASVEAKGKKNKSASLSKSKRFSAKNKKRRSKKGAEDYATIPANYPIAPDRIEVIENGEATSPDVSRHLNLPSPRSQSTGTPSETPDISAPKRRKNVKIDETRTLQIQQALKQRGFYNGDLTGVYDTDTIDAMRRFQINKKINATGYPTAHALKRLGLTNW